MKMLSFKGSASALIVSLALIPSLSAATVITSVDRATFQAAVSGSTIAGQNFDSLAVGSILGAAADLTYGASAGTPIVTTTYLTSTDPNGLGSTSAGYFLPSETATFSFNSPITAFAIDVNTYAPADGAYSASLNSGDVVSSLHEVFPNTTTGQFIGFVSDTAFSSVTISATTGFSYTLDTLVYGSATAVPEPEAYAMLLAGLGLLGWRMRNARS
jgi:hypothetical protein